MRPDEMKNKKNAEMAVLAGLMLTGSSIWYFYSRPPAQAVRASTVAANYKPMKVENPQIHWGRRSEEHTSELQSQSNLVCRLLLEKKKNHGLPHHHQPRRRFP